MASPDIIELDLFKYRSEDFDLSLPVLNLDGTPYNFINGTQAKCTLTKTSGDGTLTSYTFSTAASTITISGNIIALKADHSVMDGVYGDYTGEVLVNIPPSDVDVVFYILNLECCDGNTVNNTW